MKREELRPGMIVINMITRKIYYISINQYEHLMNSTLSVNMFMPYSSLFVLQELVDNHVQAIVDSVAPYL